MPNPLIALYSVGHSNHEWGTFLALLARHGIERLVDVRSQPVSRYTPYFSYPEIGKNLATKGIEYTFLGRELGGRPEADEFYDDQGHVLYDRWAASPLFQSGLEQLVRLAAVERTVMMCSEEDPCICHRRLLIARVLAGHKPEAQAKEAADSSLALQACVALQACAGTPNVCILHIRGDGRLETDDELNEQERQAAGREQMTLFEVDAERPWKSLRSVLPKARPPIFSAD